MQGEEDQDDFNAFKFKYTPDEDDEFFRVLTSREVTSCCSFMITSHWIVNARLDSIKWIFNVSFRIFFHSFMFFYRVVLEYNIRSC